MHLNGTGNVRGVGILLVQVSDIQRSLAFWREGLGIQLRDEHEDGSWQTQLGDLTFILHPDFSSSLKGVRRGSGIAIHLSVDDADAYHAALVSRGIEPREKPTDKPWGREFAVVDPDGYEIEIVGPLKPT